MLQILRFIRTYSIIIPSSRFYLLYINDYNEKIDEKGDCGLEIEKFLLLSIWVTVAQSVKLNNLSDLLWVNVIKWVE